MIKENVINRFNPKLKQYLMAHVIGIIVLLTLAFSLTDLSKLLRNFLILLIALALPAYGFIVLVFNHWSYLIKDNDITINSGIIFKKSKTIALNAILNVTQKQGPLMSLFGITNLGLWTASPSQLNIKNANSINSPEGVIYLSNEEAKELQEYINNFRNRQNSQN